MATETEIIQDFVARLGFQVNRSEEARFNTSLTNLTKTVAGIAAGLAAAGAAIATAVVSMSSKFDQLYFASQRTGASVNTIRSLGYALSQVGGSAEKALELLDGISTAIRTNPGNEGLLNSLGVVTRENGQLRETGKILDDLMAKLPNRHDYFVTQQIATSLGIPDERTWQILVTQWEQIQKYREEYNKTSSALGIDPEKAAEASNKLMTSFRSLMNTVELTVQRILIDLQVPLNKVMSDFAKWIEEHQSEIVNAVNTTVKAIRGLVEILSVMATAVQPAVDAFAKLAGAIGSDQSDSVKTALTGILIFMGASWVPKMLKFLTAVGGPWAKIAMLIGAGTIWARGGTWELGGAAARSAGMGQTELGPGETTAVPGPGDPFNKHMEEKGVFGGAIDWFKKKMGWTKEQRQKDDNAGDQAPAKDLVKVTTKSGKSAWVNKNYAPQFQGFINDLEATGYQIDELEGFADRVNANNPSVMSHHAYGKAIDINPSKNPNRSTQTDLPANTADLAKKWGLGWGMNWRSVKDPMHFSGGQNEGGRLMSEEELKHLADVPGKQSMLDNSYLGGVPGRSATLNQRTEVTILGSTDPAATSSLFGNENSRVNGELLRNAQTAFT